MLVYGVDMRIAICVKRFQSVALSTERDTVVTTLSAGKL